MHGHVLQIHLQIHPSDMSYSLMYCTVHSVDIAAAWFSPDEWVGTLHIKGEKVKRRNQGYCLSL